MCWCQSEVRIKTTEARCILNQAELSGLGLCSMTYFPSQASTPGYLHCSPLKVRFKLFRLHHQRERRVTEWSYKHDAALSQNCEFDLVEMNLPKVSFWLYGGYGRNV